MRLHLAQLVGAAAVEEKAASLPEAGMWSSERQKGQSQCRAP